MEKAFDIKELAAELKSHGLELAEEAAVIVAKATLEWLAKSVQKSENKFDDFFVVVRPMIEPELLRQIDRIDGQEG